MPREILKAIADKHRIDPELLEKLIEYESTKVHLRKRRGARKDLRRIIETFLEKETS